VVRPFVEFCAYRGWVVILLFALLYNTAMRWAARWRGRSTTSSASPAPEIFGVTKSFGVAATILAGWRGGILVARYGLFKSLFVAGILQAVTNLLFSWQALAGTTSSC
jgi:PAT family beta-lactamase induction signal transducer AmpG